MLEAAGFDVLVTGDQNLAYQQNLRGRDIAIVELPLRIGPASKSLSLRFVQRLQDQPAARTR